MNCISINAARISPERKAAQPKSVMDSTPFRYRCAASTNNHALQHDYHKGSNRVVWLNQKPN